MAADFHTHDAGAAGKALVSAERPIPGKLVSLELHPWKIGADFPVVPGDFAARLAECAALGEVGYDPLRGDPARQLAILPQLLALAAELNKPVVLHLVRPTAGVFALLARYPLRYLVHGFRGRADKLARCLERGHFVSLGARALADPGVAEYLKQRGWERVGFETDAEKTDIREVVQLAAAATGRSDVERATDANFGMFVYGENR